MSDETRESPPAKEPGSAKRLRSSGANLQNLTAAKRNMAAISEQLSQSPGLKAMAESMTRLNEMAELSGVKKISESIERLNSLTTRQVPKISPEVYKIPPIPERPEIGWLRAVHEELQSVADVLAKGAQGTAVMLEVTRANLTAVQAVVEELTKGREASDRSSRALFWLTVALFVATGVGAVALAPEFIHQLTGMWSWVQALH